MIESKVDEQNKQPLNAALEVEIPMDNQRRGHDQQRLHCNAPGIAERKETAYYTFELWEM